MNDFSGDFSFQKSRLAEFLTHKDLIKQKIGEGYSRLSIWTTLTDAKMISMTYSYFLRLCRLQLDADGASISIANDEADTLMELIHALTLVQRKIVFLPHSGQVTSATGTRILFMTNELMHRFASNMGIPLSWQIKHGRLDSEVQSWEKMVLDLAESEPDERMRHDLQESVMDFSKLWKAMRGPEVSQRTETDDLTFFG